jgi:hypothetical protein
MAFLDAPLCSECETKDPLLPQDYATYRPGDWFEGAGFTNSEQRLLREYFTV